MTTSYSFNQATLELTISKAFEKNASIYGTDEYKTILSLRKDYPKLKIVVQVKKGNEKGANNKLTYTKMRDFIKLCPNSDERLATFDRVYALSKCQRSPYAYVKRWFLDNYANYSEYPEFANGCVIPKTRKEMEAEKAVTVQNAAATKNSATNDATDTEAKIDAAA